MVSAGTASLDGVAALDHAAAVFRWSSLERDIVEALLAAALGEVAREPSVADVAATLRASAARAEVLAAFHRDSPLASFALIALRGDGPTLGQRVALDEDFVPYLAGGRPVGGVRPIVAAEPPLDALALAPAITARVATARAWLRDVRGRWPTVVVHGPVGAGRGALATALAAEHHARVLALDGAQLDARTLRVWRRELAWHQAVAVIANADQADADALRALAARTEAALYLTTATPIATRVLGPGRALHVLEVDALTGRDRAAIWDAALARAGAAEHGIDTTYLGSRFPFAPARIATAAAALAGPGPAPTTEVAEVLCRSLPEITVGGLAARIATTHRWRDLVVTPEVRGELELITTWGRAAAALFPPEAAGTSTCAPRGLACLFHGASGTGKTLAAQVIAGELGRELYRVDLSRVVDKYLGETEKRLDLVFREAEAAGAVLFFDEADALFARRTAVGDARDRYANLETSFLLQRLEDHAGLTILATNLLDNLDSAFRRRLAIVVELPLPGAAERRLLWEKFLPPPAARAADIGVERIATDIPLAGGQIRNTVFAATLLAGRYAEPLAMKHVAVAIWRELKHAGRLFDLACLGPWGGAVVSYVEAQRR